MASRTVYLVLPPQGFDDFEYTTVSQTLRESGYDVLAVSTQPYATSVGGTETVAKRTFGDEPVDSSEVVAVVFLDGPGTVHYHYHPRAHALATQVHQSGRVLAASGVGLSVLANAGVLRGRTVAAVASERQNLLAHGVEQRPAGTVNDGAVVTASGAAVAAEFAAALLATLRWREN